MKFAAAIIPFGAAAQAQNAGYHFQTADGVTHEGGRRLGGGLSKRMLGINSDCDGTGLLSHSTDSTLIISTNTPACGTGAGTTAQKWARCYVLGEDCTGERKVDSINFAAELVAQNGGPPVDLKINVWKDAGCNAGTPGVLGELIASADQQVFDADTGSIIAVPINSEIPLAPTDAIRVEIEQASDGTLAEPQFRFFPGSNSAGQTADTFIAAPDCGLTTFGTMTSIGWPDTHIILDVETSPVNGDDSSDSSEDSSDSSEDTDSKDSNGNEDDTSEDVWW